MNYSDVIFRHAPANAIKPLDAIYHSALCVITGDSDMTHHCILIDKVAWFSVNEKQSPVSIYR